MSNYNATNDSLEGVSGMTLTDIYNALGLLLSGTNVTVTNLPSSQNVNVISLYYPSSISNNTNIQLAPGATFTGGIETILNLQAAQVQIVCDQPYIVSINQYIDQLGTQPTNFSVFTRVAGQTLCENITLPGNYFNITVKNIGSSPTTTFALNTTFGIMDTLPYALSNNGNLTVAVQEVGGNVIPAVGIPVFDTSLNDALTLIRRLVKLCEPLSNIDAGGRQRVTVDSAIATVTGVTTVGTVTTVAGITNFLGMGQQQFSDNARTAYNTGLRNNLNFS